MPTDADPSECPLCLNNWAIFLRVEEPGIGWNSRSQRYETYASVPPDWPGRNQSFRLPGVLGKFFWKAIGENDPSETMTVWAEGKEGDYEQVEVATTLIGDALREALGSEPNATVERHPEHRCAPIVLVDLDDCSVAAPVLARHYPALLYCMAGELWVTSTREDADSPLRLGRVEDLLDELPQGASADIFLGFGEHRYRWRDPNFSRKPDSWARGGAVPLGSPRCRTVAYESSEGAVLGLMGDKGYASPDNVLPASWLDTCVGLDDYLS